MYTPRTLCRLAINDDGRRARVKNKRQRKKTGFDLDAGPGLLCGHSLEFNYLAMMKDPVLRRQVQARLSGAAIH